MGEDRFEKAIKEARAALEEVAAGPSREKALSQTKLDEAVLWYWALKNPGSIGR